LFGGSGRFSKEIEIMTDEELKDYMDEFLPEGWENCLEEIESFIFGDARVAARYKSRELVGALGYLLKELHWKAENPGKEELWQGSHEWEHAMNLSQGYVDHGGEL
jgi:hypothetical protein